MPKCVFLPLEALSFLIADIPQSVWSNKDSDKENLISVKLKYAEVICIV